MVLLEGQRRLTVAAMGAKRGKRKNPRDKDLTSRYLSGAIEEDRLDASERYSGRDASAQQRKMEKTALLRLAEEAVDADVDKLPIGDVAQVYSLFVEVEAGGISWLCVVRKTMTKLS